MDLPVDPATIRCLPRKSTAKNGQAIELRLLEEPLHESLVAMYLAYQPRNSFQGLPPLKDAVCIQWVREMIQTGINIVALGPWPTILGHIALFPINPKKCEMLVVVSPAYQDLGIGTELTRSLVELAVELGFEKVWLPVAANNLRARHVYKKCGFQYVSDKPSRELDMVLDLTQLPRSHGSGGGTWGLGPLPLPETVGNFIPLSSPIP